MCKELIASRIRIIEIDLGQVETKFRVVRFDGDKEKAKKVYEGVEPLTPDRIAEVVVFAVARRENAVLANTFGVSEPSGESLLAQRPSAPPLKLAHALAAISSQRFFSNNAIDRKHLFTYTKSQKTRRVAIVGSSTASILVVSQIVFGTNIAHEHRKYWPPKTFRSL
jgi:hypothetical protein